MVANAGLFGVSGYTNTAAPRPAAKSQGLLMSFFGSGHRAAAAAMLATSLVVGYGGPLHAKSLYDAAPLSYSGTCLADGTDRTVEFPSGQATDAAFQAQCSNGRIDKIQYYTGAEDPGVAKLMKLPAEELAKALQAAGIIHEQEGDDQARFVDALRDFQKKSDSD